VAFDRANSFPIASSFPIIDHPGGSVTAISDRPRESGCFWRGAKYEPQVRRVPLVRGVSKDFGAFENLQEFGV
jgi:hypothetical protein